MDLTKKKVFSISLSSLSLFSESFRESSDLFATCSKNDIRVWYTPEHRELLRIVVPENVTCHAIEIMSDGSNIISGNSPCQEQFEVGMDLNSVHRFTQRTLCLQLVL